MSNNSTTSCQAEKYDKTRNSCHLLIFTKSVYMLGNVFTDQIRGNLDNAQKKMCFFLSGRSSLIEKNHIHFHWFHVFASKCRILTSSLWSLNEKEEEEEEEMNEPNFFLLPRSFLWSYSGGIGRMMSPISQLCLLIFPAACIPDDYHKFSTLNDLYLVTLFNIQFPGLPHPPMRETPASTSSSSPSLSFLGLGCHPGL